MGGWLNGLPHIELAALTRTPIIFGANRLMRARDEQSLAGIAVAAEQGTLVPEIGRIVPFSEAIQAVVALEKTGLLKGKLVIVPNR